MQLNSPPKAGSRSSDLVGKPLVITEVKGERVVETSLGEATAVVIDVLVLEHDAFENVWELRHIPDVLIFWSVVQRQLLSDDFAAPAAGKFLQHGKAYTLDELDENELLQVAALFSDDEPEGAAEAS